jgi:hypothetical protein
MFGRNRHNMRAAREEMPAGSRGQFFSFDVLAGAFIFLLAFFILAFYWLNAQALFAQQETGDMQREAERVADQLMVKDGMGPEIITDYALIYSGGKLNPPAGYKVDDVHQWPVVAFGDGYTGKLGGNQLNPFALSHFILMSNLLDSNGGKRFYADMKEKLGMPKYEYYVTIEGVDINPATGDYYLTRCLELLPPSPSGTYRPEKGCWAGKNPADPGSGVTQVANAERIVVFTDYTVDSGDTSEGGTYLAKLRVQVWQ